MKRSLILFLLLALLIVGSWFIFNFRQRASENSSPKNTQEEMMPSPSQPGGEGNEMSEALTRTDQGEGAVNVAVTFVTSEYLKAQGAASEDFDLDKEFVFLISLNTHSVDLSAYKLDELTILRNEEGKEFSPLSGWKAVGESGHHRSGYIRFLKKDSQGNSIISKDAKSFAIIIKEIAGVKERIFSWDLPLR